MAETMKALPKKSAEDLAERLRLKSCSSRSSSDCCRPPRKICDYHKYIKVFFRSLTTIDIVTFITLTMN